MTRRIIVTILTLLIGTSVFSQNRQALFMQAEYQFLKYNYLTIGLGFQPKKSLLQATRKHPKYSFIGWTANYSKKLENSDWGASIQTIMYTASTSGPFGIGLEGNYKSVNNTNHFAFKPLIGLSFPIVSIMYGYNFDFYKTKSERINQHELILGFRFPLISKKK